MKMKSVVRIGVVASLALLLASCAHKGAGQDPCNPVVGAVVGGVAGAMLGGSRHRDRGALIGASLGALACVAYNYNTRQTKTAQQVGDEYRARNRQELPAAPMVTAYRTETRKSSARGGEDVTVTSNIEVVPGSREPLRELREEFAVMDPNGVERSKIVKTPVAAGQAGGAYVSTLQFTFPQGVPPGEYQVRSRVFVNGAEAKASQVRIQVAGHTGSMQLAAGAQQ